MDVPDRPRATGALMLIFAAASQNFDSRLRTRTVANVFIAVLGILLLIFVSEIVLLLFAAILVAVLLRPGRAAYKATRDTGRWAVLIVVTLLSLHSAQSVAGRTDR